MLDILIILVLGHLITDFLLQSDRTCADKQGLVVRARTLAHLKHLGVYIIINSVFLVATGNFSLPITLVVLGLVLTHCALDLVKSSLTKRVPDLVLLLADQALHFLALAFAVWLLFPGDFVRVLPQLASDLLHHQSVAHHLNAWQKAGLSVSLLIIVTAGANVLIRSILTSLNIRMTFRAPDQEQSEVINNRQGHAVRTGRYIGGVERVLTILAILAGSYESIVALYASKTAIRFKNASGNPEFEEYYILGTLLSVLIGVTAGILLVTIVR